MTATLNILRLPVK